MPTWSESDARPATVEAPPTSPRLATLDELSRGTGPLTASDLAALRSLLAQERVPVWRPSAACVVLGAAIWALAFVGLWAIVAG